MYKNKSEMADTLHRSNGTRPKIHWVVNQKERWTFSSSHPPKLSNLTKFYKQQIALLYQNNSF